MRFNILAGAGQITFPIYKVPVVGGVQPAEPETMSDIIVAIDGETIPHDATGKCLTALYSDVAEGRHIITVAFAIEERSYVIEYVVRAEIAGYPAVITAPNAYVSLYPETPESIYDTQLSETSKNALQNKVITAVIGTTDLQTLVTEAKTIVGAINEIAPHNEGAQGDMLQLNEDGEPVWATPAAGTTLDEVPTENSNNGVKSGGVWSFVMSVIPVIAEAMLYLYNEGKALRELLTGKDNAVLPVIKAQSVECDDILTLGVPNVLYSNTTGAPSAAVTPDNWNEETMTVWNGCPRKVGQQYVDQAGGKVYYAIKVTGSTNDWVLLN